MEQSQETNGKQTTEEIKVDVDPLKLYFREPYVVNEWITINVPTVGDIMKLGQIQFFSGISAFTSNPTTYRLMLWDNGVDWNKITEWELFTILYHDIDKEACRLVLGGFDVSQLTLVRNRETGEAVLGIIHEDGEVDEVINETTYKIVSQYIRTMLDQHPKVEKAKGKATKEAIIDEERMNLEYIKSGKKKQENFSLLPLVSTLVNHPGFKYKTSELKEVGIFEFMDSVKRLQIYESTKSLYSGMYSGMADLSKVPKEQFNWFRTENK